MANTTVKANLKEAQKNFDLNKVVDKVKEGAKDMNEFMLENTDALVKEAVERSEQWQNVAAKAVKGGLKLTANTQDIVFDTLDTLKGQIKEGRTRIKGLFSKN
jgi:hypothetical protein